MTRKKLVHCRPVGSRDTNSNLVNRTALVILCPSLYITVEASKRIPSVLVIALHFLRLLRMDTGLNPGRPPPVRRGSTLRRRV